MTGKMLSSKSIKPRYDDKTTDDFDVMLLMGHFDNSQRAAMYALIAFSCVLLLSTMLALGIIVRTTWLKRNGHRKRGRLAIFVVCLLSILVSRAISVSVLLDNLNGPQNGYRYSYYDSYSFLLRHVLDGLFTWIAEISLSLLILLEITMSYGSEDQRHTLFERGNQLFIFCLLLLVVTSWGIDTRYTMGPWHEDNTWGTVWAALPGVQTTYASLAVVFASEVLFFVFKKSFPKKQSLLLKVFAVALLLGQLFYLVKTTVRFFAPVTSAYTSVWAISSVVEVCWCIKLLTMALLARNSSKMVRAGVLLNDDINTRAKPEGYLGKK